MPMSRPHAVTRRAFAVAAAGLLFPHISPAQPKDDDPPVSGTANTDLAPLDSLMTGFIRDNAVPGAALAVSRGGKLVYARGFGYADADKKIPVRPDSLFRIASVSKPITAVAVLRLIEKKKFKLDDKVTELMRLKPAVARGDTVDERWKAITVRHCLQHSGGWDRDKSFDPITRPVQAARAVGKPGPAATPTDLVRYMMGQPLDFDPGEKAVYSNLGYLVLGRIIAATTGATYEDFVKKEVFGRIGVTAPRLGRALPEKRAAGEVHYYDSKKRTNWCLYPPRLDRKVPLPDGGENFEAFEAHGGWVASAVDLVKFAAAFDDPTKSPLLGAAAITDMWARPAHADTKGWHIGCGWFVRPVGDGGKVNVWHAGYISGTEAVLVRRWDGTDWAVLFNTNDGAGGKSLAGLIEGPLHEAVDAVKQWPDGDQFPTYLK